MFYNDSFNGIYRKIPREFVLSNWKNNFLGEIPQKLILSYFEHNKISWWGGKNQQEIFCRLKLLA